MTSNNVTEPENVEAAEPLSAKSVDDQLIDELVGGPRPRACSWPARAGCCSS